MTRKLKMSQMTMLYSTVEVLMLTTTENYGINNLSYYSPKIDIDMDRINKLVSLNKKGDYGYEGDYKRLAIKIYGHLRNKVEYVANGCISSTPFSHLVYDTFNDSLHAILNGYEPEINLDKYTVIKYYIHINKKNSEYSSGGIEHQEDITNVPNIRSKFGRD